MAVLEKEELINKVTDVLDSGNETHISLLEDITDTVNALSNSESEGAKDFNYESDDNPYKEKYEEMKKRYFERFRNSGKESETKLEEKVEFEDVLKEGV